MTELRTKDDRIKDKGQRKAFVTEKWIKELKTLFLNHKALNVSCIEEANCREIPKVCLKLSSKK